MRSAASDIKQVRVSSNPRLFHKDRRQTAFSSRSSFDVNSKTKAHPWSTGIIKIQRKNKLETINGAEGS